jgi:AbrB family looped-hinge helix DNA binding protein
MNRVRITSKGQVTIPLEIREALGLLPNTEVEFEIDGTSVRLRKAAGGQERGNALVNHLRGRSTVSMSTDEILALTRGDD